MRIRAWLRKYLEYLERFYPNATIAKTKAGLLRFAFGGHEGRVSMMGAAIPIWADGTSKPALVRLIRGKSELLLGIDIIRKMDLAVNFGGESIQGWEE